MGKVRKPRQKYHLAKARSTGDLSRAGGEARPTLPPPAVSVPGDVFAGVEVPTSALGRRLGGDADDARSIVTTKSCFREAGVSKTERRALRREAFTRKLDALEALRGQSRKPRSRAPPSACDLRSLVDALPLVGAPLVGVPLAEAPFERETPEVPRQRPTLRAAKRRREALKDMDVFRRIRSDPAYRTDPTGAISNYIQEKIQRELMEQM